MIGVPTRLCCSADKILARTNRNPRIMRRPILCLRDNISWPIRILLPAIVAPGPSPYPMLEASPVRPIASRISRSASAIAPTFSSARSMEALMPRNERRPASTDPSPALVWELEDRTFVGRRTWHLYSGVRRGGGVEEDTEERVGTSRAAFRGSRGSWVRRAGLHRAGLMRPPASHRK